MQIYVRFKLKVDFCTICVFIIYAIFVLQYLAIILIIVIEYKYHFSNICSVLELYGIWNLSLKKNIHI